jgi:hypothetical protein
VSTLTRTLLTHSFRPHYQDTVLSFMVGGYLGIGEEELLAESACISRVVQENVGCLEAFYCVSYEEIRM